MENNSECETISDGSLVISPSTLEPNTSKTVTAIFRTLTGNIAVVYGTNTDTLRSLLEAAKIQLRFDDCIAILDGISATAEILNKSADELKLYQYNCIMVVPKPQNLSRIELQDTDPSIRIIPDEIDNLQNLTKLYLDDNQLATAQSADPSSRILPDEIGNLPRLTTIFLDNNQLTSELSSITNKIINIIE